jgi:hypothetical protein
MTSVRRLKAIALTVWDRYLDAWYAVTYAFGTVAGLSRLEAWFRARRRERRVPLYLDLARSLDDAGMTDSAQRLRGIANAGG